MADTLRSLSGKVKLARGNSVEIQTENKEKSVMPNQRENRLIEYDP
jgi:hypothetical protein